MLNNICKLYLISYLLESIVSSYDKRHLDVTKEHIYIHILFPCQHFVPATFKTKARFQYSLLDPYSVRCAGC